jgi:adenosylmethionine-8-amino-7-oxononanoate aminotransferase
MSVSGRSIWTKPFGDMLFDVIFIDTPTSENLESLKSQIKNIADEIACLFMNHCSGCSRNADA